MIQHLLHITGIELEGKTRLFPDGVSWTLRKGMNAIVGGTGLGKTTLANAALFTLFGRLNLTTSSTRPQLTHEYFHGRLGDFRPGEDPVQMTVTAKIGKHAVAVTRNLMTGRLVRVVVDKKETSPRDYETTICRLTGASDFVQHLVRLIDHLLYVSDEHYLLAWDSKSQNEIFHLLFGKSGDFDKLHALWEDAQSADSKFRNVRHQAQGVRKEIEGAGEEKPAKVSRIKAEAKALMELRLRAEEQLQAARDAESIEKINHEVARQKLEEEQERFRGLAAEVALETQDDLDRQILEEVFSAPLQSAVYWGIVELSRSRGTQTCPCCLRIPGTETRLLRQIRSVVESDGCPACGVAIEDQKPLEVSAEAQDLLEDLERSADDLRTLIVDAEAAESRLKVLREEAGRTEEVVQRARQTEWDLKSKSPSAFMEATDRRQILLGELEAQRDGLEKLRDRKVAQFTSAQERHQANFNTLFDSLREAFAEYCRLFLDEECSVELDPEGERAKRRGPQLDPLHAAFYPVVAGTPRYRPDELSEAQRLFVDLAFRMAVLAVWKKRTGQTGTLVFETPEGTVDIAYMVRVADMLRSFSNQGHTVLLTTNLNNQELLAGILRSIPSNQRRSRILNLLEVGTPRPVQREHMEKFNQIIQAAIEA